MTKKYVLDKPDNLVELFEETLEKHAARPWLGAKNLDTKEYKWITYGEGAEKIDRIRGGLAKLGVKKGDSVAIIDNNSVEWATCCFATYETAARDVSTYTAE